MKDANASISEQLAIHDMAEGENSKVLKDWRCTHNLVNILLLLDMKSSAKIFKDDPFSVWTMACRIARRLDGE